MKFAVVKKSYLKIILFLQVFLIMSGFVFSAESERIKGTLRVVNTDSAIYLEENNSLVSVDSETGNVTGYAWSEDLGWIDFGNNGEADPVKINFEDGVVSGTAFVINTGGHIYFSENNSNVTWGIHDGVFSGYAWSEDLGWIDFSEASLLHVQIENTGGELIRTGENMFWIFLGSFIIVTCFISSSIIKKAHK